MPPSLLINCQNPSKVQASVSSIVSALAFCDVLFSTASVIGKARLLDGSTQQGPSAWHVRMLKSESFRDFEQGTDPISARAADLLACPPPLVLINTHCLSCSFQPGLTLVPLGTDARHFVRSRKGLRLHGAVSDRVGDEEGHIQACPNRFSAQKMSVILIIQAGRPEKLLFLPAFDARILTLRSQKTGYGLLLRCRSGLNRGPDEKNFF